jgi:hypothetical protein
MRQISRERNTIKVFLRDQNGCLRLARVSLHCKNSEMDLVPQSGFKRVLGYRSGGPGSIPGTTRVSERR